MNWNKIFAVLILLAVIIFIITVIFISIPFFVLIFGKNKYHCENGKCVAGYSKGKTIYGTHNCDNEC